MEIWAQGGLFGGYVLACMVLAFRLLGAERLPLSRRAAQAVPGGLVLALVLFMAW
ncbi:hypothetical protein GO986_02365 [Deinococcus sp. HMF7620]|uniref:Uncharacterized protein n=1 Tax=Deinococcus arboris TaxID=2682977 RepID=A0A7C9M6E8_9DEIO|nr:hypothetical protein [Deinococcus arboris]MVN85603.1 hypothetical protein [Deinococcus arboris]